MNYINLVIKNSHIEDIDTLIAMLDYNTGFDSIHEGDEELTVSYVDRSGLEAELNQKLEELDIVKEWTIESVENKNWNEVFESSFSPIIFEDKTWGIRASFHDPLEVENEIVIDPKMSFGTGHHETTYQMMKMMTSIEFKGKDVWDYGSGTGVLAIMASMLGAKNVIANDVEEWAYNNSIENKDINNCSNIDIYEGDIDTLESINALKDDSRYSVILANITKNILLASALKIDKYSSSGTDLLLSGFYESDIDDILSQYSQYNFYKINSTTKNKWSCLHLKKK